MTNSKIVSIDEPQFDYQRESATSHNIISDLNTKLAAETYQFGLCKLTLRLNVQIIIATASPNLIQPGDPKITHLLATYYGCSNYSETIRLNLGTQR